MKKLLIISIVLAINFASQAQNTFPSNGNVGIGTVNPGAKLEIKSTNGLRTLLNMNDLSGISFLPNNGNSIFHISHGLNNDLNISHGISVGAVNLFTIKNNGNVGIGTKNPDSKLAVNGKIHAEEVKIDLSIPAPDYVFREDYNLRSLNEVEKFIKENNHLPEIPSAKEFKNNGLMLAEMDMNLLRKVEELTLYTIQQQKEIEIFKKENKKLQKIAEKFNDLQSRLEKLESIK